MALQVSWHVNMQDCLSVCKKESYIDEVDTMLVKFFCKLTCSNEHVNMACYKVTCIMIGSKTLKSCVLLKSVLEPLEVNE